MAKRSITYDLHGTKWKVHQDLAHSPGLRIAQEYFSGYDWSQVEWVTVNVGAWGGSGTINDEELGGWTSPVAGRCQQLRSTHTRGGLYRLNCRVNTRLGWPANQRTRVSPLYRNEDGSWPDVPEGHESGAWLIDPKTEQEWKRLYRLLSLRDQDEALVWIIAHEAFHYLRRSRQIDGKNVEIEDRTGPLWDVPVALVCDRGGQNVEVSSTVKGGSFEEHRIGPCVTYTHKSRPTPTGGGD